jgi:hypothetical protein
MLCHIHHHCVVMSVHACGPRVVLAEGAAAVSTFNCIGLYWSPRDGAPENPCVAKYREEGSEEWQQALQLWFDAREAEELPVEQRRQYRGSIVNLTAGTAYEIELSLEKTQRRTLLYAQTWDEHFPIGATVTVSDDRGPLIIDRSGSPQGYLLYTHAPGRTTATIDVRNTRVHCVVRVLRDPRPDGNAQARDPNLPGCRLSSRVAISAAGAIEDDGWGHEQMRDLASAADLQRSSCSRNASITAR